MFFGLEIGEIEVSGFISDFDLLFLILVEIFDMLFNEYDFKLGDLWKVCFLGVEGGDEYFFIGLVMVDLVGVGGFIFMIGMNEGDFILFVVLFDVKVKCVLGLWFWLLLLFVVVVL